MQQLHPVTEVGDMGGGRVADLVEVGQDGVDHRLLLGGQRRPDEHGGGDALAERPVQCFSPHVRRRDPSQHAGVVRPAADLAGGPLSPPTVVPAPGLGQERVAPGRREPVAPTAGAGGRGALPRDHLVPQ